MVGGGGGSGGGPRRIGCGNVKRRGRTGTNGVCGMAEAGVVTTFLVILHQKAESTREGPEIESLDPPSPLPFNSSTPPSTRHVEKSSFDFVALSRV